MWPKRKKNPIEEFAKKHNPERLTIEEMAKRSAEHVQAFGGEVRPHEIKGPSQINYHTHGLDHFPAQIVARNMTHYRWVAVVNGVMVNAIVPFGVNLHETGFSNEQYHEARLVDQFGHIVALTRQLISYTAHDDEAMAAFEMEFNENG